MCSSDLVCPIQKAMVGFRPGDGGPLLSNGAQALLQVSSDKLYLLRGDIPVLGHLGIASAGFAVGAGGVALLSGMCRASGKNAPMECEGDA